MVPLKSMNNMFQRRSSAIVLCLGFATHAALAQDFGEQIVISGGSEITYPRSVGGMDVDGDGDQDILVGSSYLSQIGWLENLGGANFGEFTKIHTANSFIEARGSDIDGDGDLDLLESYSASYDKVVWRENLGGGTFSSTSQDIAGPQDNPEFMLERDLDGDGDRDLLVGSSGDREVAWYENLGGGSFGAKQVFVSQASDPISRVDAGDLDGDAIADVIYSVGADLICHPGQGSGTFGSAQTLYTGQAKVTEATLADVDGDLDLDVLCYESPELVWLENQGGLVFSGGQTFGDSTSYVTGLAPEDTDGDGDVDVLSVSKYDRIVFHENLGGGAFAPDDVLESGIANPTRVDLTDLDGDGDLDALYASKDLDQIGWFENLGVGGFASPVLIVTTPDVQAAGAVEVDDLDGDGDLDVICASRGNGRLSWFSNLGGGQFGGQNILGEESDSLSITHADMDGDGDVDLAWGTFESLFYVQNVGGGAFAAPVTIELKSSSFPIVLDEGDFNGDGLTDILCGWLNPHEVVWYRNLGGGAFAAPQLIESNVIAFDQIGEDVNADGALDVVVGTVDGTVKWYRNLGNGLFSNPITIATGFPQCRIHLGDLTGDGINDLVVSSPSELKLSYFPSWGGGYNSERVIDDFALYIYDIKTADIDRDGDQDLVCAENLVGSVIWYQTPDNPFDDFSEPRLVSEERVAVGVLSVDVADLDGDGDADVLSASSRDSKLAAYENFIGDECGTRYCGSTQNPNNVATISISSCDSSATEIQVSLAEGPANQFVYLLVGNGNGTVSQPPGAKGDLCVVGGSCLGRYDKDVGQIAADGTFATDVLQPLSNPCAGAVTIAPGATWNFQYWHRQPMGQPATFSDAISVTFE